MRAEHSCGTVAITAHPGRELDDRGVVGEALIDADVLERRVDAAEELGHAVPDGVVEVAHPSPHLVLRLRLRPQDLVRPQRRQNLRKSTSLITPSGWS